MSLTPIELEIDQGDDEVIDLTIVAPPAFPSLVDLTSCKLFFFVKASTADADAAALIRKTSDASDGITITNVAGGVANVTIDRVNTSGFLVSQTGKKLNWALQVKDAAGKITTLAKGTLVVNRDLIQASI